MEVPEGLTVIGLELVPTLLEKSDVVDISKPAGGVMVTLPIKLEPVKEKFCVDETDP